MKNAKIVLQLLSGPNDGSKQMHWSHKNNEIKQITEESNPTSKKGNM